MRYSTSILTTCSLLLLAAISSGQAATADRLLSDFNIPGEWKVSKWSKLEGRTAIRPEAPEALSDVNPPLTKSLGLKVDWPGGEGFRFCSLVPSSETPIPYKVNAIKIWINGSNTEHFCEIILNDANEQRQKIGLGKLNFQGWKQLQKRLPATIVQPVTITGITIHDWGNPQPGETTVYLTRLEVNIDTEADIKGGAEGQAPAATDTNDAW